MLERRRNALPHCVESGVFHTGGHVQGIATDGEHMAFSFTTEMVVTDLAGRPVGSAGGLTGHLGCITYVPKDGCVYGSLEVKRDEIGAGILRRLGVDRQEEDAFYIARFDLGRITRMGMDAVQEGVMTVLRLSDVMEDYAWEGEGRRHRYGCSGIDGIAYAPGPVAGPGPNVGPGPEAGGADGLYVAYGIYGDVAREDNDWQVLLYFPLQEISGRFRPLKQAETQRAAQKLFVFTGNTTYGIQNLEYDPETRCFLAAVYAGKKPGFPNYTLFFIDAARPPEYGLVCGQRQRLLSLAPRGKRDEKTGLWGSRFPYGSTGIAALGGGYFYFSQEGSTPDGGYFTRAVLYRLRGDVLEEAPVPRQG
jgi:hypothetical protein